MSQAFPSNYLRAADLQGRRVRVQISRVQMEDIGGDHKPVMYFQGKEKGMVLNKTNANAIGMFYGDEMDDWTGKMIELFEAMVDFQGKTTPAIRLKVIPDAAKVAQMTPAQPEPQRLVTAETLDDEIPF
jgi:arabinogalactan endo-1,4-beta-galactosidase